MTNNLYVCKHIFWLGNIYAIICDLSVFPLLKMAFNSKILFLPDLSFTSSTGHSEGRRKLTFKSLATFIFLYSTRRLDKMRNDSSQTKEWERVTEVEAIFLSILKVISWPDGIFCTGQNNWQTSVILTYCLIWPFINAYKNISYSKNVFM